MLAYAAIIPFSQYSGKKEETVVRKNESCTIKE
jgi:hypothetical protein